MFQSRFHRWSCIIFLIILSNYSTSTTNTTTQDVTVNSSSVTVVGSTIITNTTSGSTTALPVVTNTSIMTTEPSFTNTTTGSISEVTTTGDYSTTAAPGDNSTLPKYVGYICAAAAVLLYGSNFAPVKKFETGDGMFFQWILCGGALLVGIIVQVIRGTKHFYPLVMIGGLVWETGNICVVPIIKTIGMGLGLCIWGMTNLLSGWATSRFGWFGMTASTQIKDPVLNTIGVVVAVSSSIVFAFVKNDVTPVDIGSDQEPLLSSLSRGSINTEPSSNDDSTFIDRLSPGKKRVLGIVLSIFSGILYGQMFTPAVYLQDHGDSKNALDYVFACFCGIYSTSTVYFIIYIIFMKNKPKVYPKAILPGVISGLMWGAATAGWFVANQVMSPAIAFPIITTGPSIIASLWGIFVFKEIRGTRNICILLLGFVFVITGAILTAFSQKN
ncbi:transmembrane protein 144-like isoform X2 [Crassostrea virginica]